MRKQIFLIAHIDCGLFTTVIDRMIDDINIVVIDTVEKVEPMCLRNIEIKPYVLKELDFDCFVHSPIKDPKPINHSFKSKKHVSKKKINTYRQNPRARNGCNRGRTRSFRKR